MARTVREYLANAEECLRLLKTMQSDEDLKALLHMAETWQSLALERQAKLAKGDSEQDEDERKAS